jgi:AraC family transcriptional regulator, regulatory protein of adaptative response / methylated-DNA-[protein]-cysteine methyltransferase
MTGDNRTAAKAGGSAEQIRFGLGGTSIGALLVALGPAGLVAIIIREHANADAQIAELERRFPNARLVRDDEGIKAEVAAVIDFVEAPSGNIELPLDIRGTDFQRRVYRQVLAIPFGQTTSFADIAVRIGSPKAVRAVGNACSNNPLEFAIPCHRVLRSDGSWSAGTAWGSRRQCTIATREAAAATSSKTGEQR